MKSLSKTLLAVLATGVLSCAVFSQQAQATAITGNINFAGSVHFNHALGSATAVTAWINPHVEAGGSGDFAGIPINTSVAMSAPWTFNPSTPTPGLWSVGGFTFDLLTSTVVFQSSAFLSISGTGVVSGNGFEPTAMDWSFSSQKSGNNTFSFSSNSTAVPDGGTTVMLLGAALGVLGMARRFLMS
jgi:hypothetical protein